MHDGTQRALTALACFTGDALVVFQTYLRLKSTEMYSLLFKLFKFDMNQDIRRYTARAYGACLVYRGCILCL
jgi:hypothetical protein